MNFKNFICLALCLIFILSAFVGCQDNDVKENYDTTNNDGASESQNDSDVSEENKEPTEELFDIIKDGWVIDVVYSTNANSDEIETTNKIANMIKTISGTTVFPHEASSEYNADKAEIIVGNVGYEITDNIISGLNYCEGVIRIDGNKLLVVAYGDEAYTALASKLTLAFNSAKKGKNVSISKSYTMDVSSNKLVSELPKAEGLNLNDIKDAGDGSYILSFKRVSENNVGDYLKALEADGYTQYAQNIIEKNKYYTYTNDKNVVTVSFTDYNDEMKIMVDKLSETALPAREADNQWTEAPGMTTTITQLGLYYEYNGKNDYFNGMSYVIRLKDGSFIIIDGGHDKTIDSDRIYNTLKKQAPDPDNIVIAAWIFTHGHEDHTGFFDYFCKTYASEVKVEQFIYNFPSANELNDAYTLATRGNILRYFKGTPIVKAHPGQVFHIRNAKITMLYTNDLWDYKTSKLTSSNYASLVFTIEMEGKKIMMLGDYADAGTLRSLYSRTTLKSDIMQVSHHGISDCGTLLYPIVAPEWALWPLGSDYIEEYDRVVSEHPMNAYMKTMDPNKVFMAEDNVVILTLDNGNVSAQVFDTDSVYFAS